MRRRRRGELLAGVGILLGLCVGCQSLPQIAPPMTSTGVTVLKPRTARAAAPDETTTVVSRSQRPVQERVSREEPGRSPGVVASNWRQVVRPGDQPQGEVRAVGHTRRPHPGASPAETFSRGNPEPVRGPMRLMSVPRGPEMPPVSGDHHGTLQPPRVVVHGAEEHLMAEPFEGVVALGPPHEGAKQALPPYIIEPPDILLVEVVRGKGPLEYDQPVRGQHLVRPDGTIGLGIYGSVFVAGLTIDLARQAVAEHLSQRVKNIDPRQVDVDVLAYNSKFYYVITDGAGYGEQVYPFPITGSETVLDAIGRINGLPAVADRSKVWVARRGPGKEGLTLGVDWVGITQRGDKLTNYQLIPGDRVYVKADRWFTADTWLAKRLAPIERLLGVTLLGAEAVNAIQGQSQR